MKARKVTKTPDTTANKQTAPNQNFTNIKAIRAVRGNIVVDVYKKGTKKSKQGAKGKAVKTTFMTVKEAVERAQALNAIALKMPEADAKDTMDLVQEIIAKCREAQEQKRTLLVDPNGKVL